MRKYNREKREFIDERGSADFGTKFSLTLSSLLGKERVFYLLPKYEKEKTPDLFLSKDYELTVLPLKY